MGVNPGIAEHSREYCATVKISNVIQGGCMDVGSLVVSVREASAAGWHPTTPEEEDDDHSEASLAVSSGGEAPMGNVVSSTGAWTLEEPEHKSGRERVE
jgi:hypothetical protein